VRSGLPISEINMFTGAERDPVSSGTGSLQEVYGEGRSIGFWDERVGSRALEARESVVEIDQSCPGLAKVG